MTVLDIRGTHASGKSRVVSQLLRNYAWVDVVGLGKATKKGPDKERELGYYCDELDAAIIGRYSLETMRGGCDLLFPEEVVRRVHWFTEKYRMVVLEGILVSHSFQRYSDLSKEIDDYRFCFLNTPLNQCIAHLDKRRSEMDQDKIRPRNIKSLVKDWHQIHKRVKEKCVDAKHNVITIDWQQSYDQILALVLGEE